MGAAKRRAPGAGAEVNRKGAKKAGGEKAIGRRIKKRTLEATRRACGSRPSPWPPPAPRTPLIPPLSMAEHQPRSCLPADLQLQQPAICLVPCYHHHTSSSSKETREASSSGCYQELLEMGECRGGDCLIKLFGKTIPVPEAGDAKVGCRGLSHHSISPVFVCFLVVLVAGVAKIDLPFC